MAKISVYDLDGVEHQRETVDVRELEALGWTREPKHVEVVAQVVEDIQPAKRGRKTSVVEAE